MLSIDYYLVRNQPYLSTVYEGTLDIEDYEQFEDYSEDKKESLIKAEGLEIIEYSCSEEINNAQYLFVLVNDEPRMRFLKVDGELTFDYVSSDETAHFYFVKEHKRSILYGYVNNVQIPILDTVEQICAFIAKYQAHSLVITDVFDNFILSVEGTFIDSCADQEFLCMKLLPVLIPIQRGETEAAIFEEIEVR